MRCGYRAEVCGITEDGNLVGRYDVRTINGNGSVWMAAIWKPDGKGQHGLESHDLVEFEPPARIKGTFWVNIYTSGPGQLRKTWEESLIEASRCEESVLCRCEVNIDAAVGEGLR